MTITVNGKTTEIEAGETLSALLGRLGVDPVRTVAERNGAIVERRSFAETVLAAGDKLELVRFVGGG
jgi:thiamine biosynthesis protein ThiS